METIHHFFGFSARAGIFGRIGAGWRRNICPNNGSSKSQNLKAGTEVALTIII